MHVVPPGLDAYASAESLLNMHFFSVIPMLGTGSFFDRRVYDPVKSYFLTPSIQNL